MLAFDPSLISLISASTALMASITGPLVAIYVARAQIKATVHSANRQKWIEEFRETIANFCGQAAVATQVRERIFRDGRVSISEKSELLHEFERLISTSAKIRLLVNPLDDRHRELILIVDEILTMFRTASITEDVQESARTSALKMIAASLAIIRHEWFRVQRGV